MLFGDCEAAKLRPGNVHSADDWQELLEPVVKGYRKKRLRLLFRGDAAFGKPEVYEYLEQEKIGYAIWLSANAVLQREITHLLVRPAEGLPGGRSSPITISPTRPKVVMCPEEWWPRWSGTRESCSLGWASS